MKMKIALAATSVLATAATAGTVYLFGLVGRASWTGYLLGWSEGRSGLEPNPDGFAERLGSMQRAQHKARRMHDQWHRDNPGKSCSEMPSPFSGVVN